MLGRGSTHVPTRLAVAKRTYSLRGLLLRAARIGRRRLRRSPGPTVYDAVRLHACEESIDSVARFLLADRVFLDDPRARR